MIQTQLIDSLKQLFSEQGEVEICETHISWVILVGEFAYKIKKAVNFGFVDFSTLAQRQYDCEEELRLNKRLAPQLYISVISIGGSATQPILGQQPAIEYAVKMHRFSQQQTLQCQLSKSPTAISAAMIEQFAMKLAHFHQKSPQSSERDDYASAQMIAAYSQQNFAQIFQQEPALERQFNALQQQAQSLFEQLRALFEQRRQHGFIRECHGDLHIGNMVVFDQQLLAFDCLEFNPDLRWIDIIDEIAFLMMDLQSKQRADLAWRFLNIWLEYTSDYAGLALLRFYLLYRAMVRAKVSYLTKKSAEGLSYLQQASGYLQQNKPRLIITHGLPGSGKSTFALEYASKFPAIRLRADVIRKRLFGLAPLENSRSHQLDIYTPEATARTFTYLYQLTEQILQLGFNVIVDSAFLKQAQRQRFFQLAQQLKIDFCIAALSADTDTLNLRIQQRQQQQDASEADEKVLTLLEQVQEPLTADEQKYTWWLGRDWLESGVLDSAM